MRVVTVGISGPSCSGKTTVTRLLQQLVNRSLVIYQDDFFKPDDQIPIDPTTQLANWDCPEALDFQRLAETIDYVQTHGALPAGYTSNEVSNTHDGSSLVPTIDPWQHRVPSDDGDDEGGAVIWLIVDGFMLLSDPTITDRLDYRFFVTASYATLKRRREERQGYHTLEGYWVDPPGYFDVIVWPEFLKAHRHIPGPHQLQNGKNNGGGGCERLVLIDTDVLTIPQMLDTVVDVLWP